MKNLDAFKAHGDVIWNIANLLRGLYETPFNRHFYGYVPPRRLADIKADILALGKDIIVMLKDVTA